MCLMGEKNVVDKLYSVMRYRVVSYEFRVNE